MNDHRFVAAVKARLAEPSMRLRYGRAHDGALTIVTIYACGCVSRFRYFETGRAELRSAVEEIRAHHLDDIARNAAAGTAA